MSFIDILITWHAAFLNGLAVTLLLCAVIWASGIAGGLLIGTMAAWRPRTWGRFVYLASFVFSAVPSLVILFWLHYPAQSFLGVVINPFWTSSFALGLVNLFAVGEIVRQGITDFPQQYIAAARVCGMSSRQIVRYIQLPLLFRQLIPGIMTQQVSMLHASLFASLISVEEIFRVAQRINSIIYKPIEIYTALAVFFIIVCMPINIFAAWLRAKYTRNISEH